MTDEIDDHFDALLDRLKRDLAPVIREQADLLSQAQRAALQQLEQSPDETGNLEASCTVAPGAHELEFIVQAGGDATTDEVRAGSGEDFDYGAAFEFGTSHQPARPFFYSTYNAMRADMQRTINEAAIEVQKDA